MGGFRIKNSMPNSFQNLKRYLKMPEMKIFWLFLFLIFLIFVIDAVYLNLFWAFLSLAIFLAVGALMFVINLKAAKANYELRLEKNKLDYIVSNLRDGVIIYDKDFKIVFFNKGAQVIFGLDAKEMIGQRLSPDSAADPKLNVLAKIIFQSLAPVVVRLSLEDEYPQIVDISFDDPHLELRVATNRLMDDGGQATGFLKIVSDRTREVDLLKSKSEFVSIAAHQLRTPLSAVNWAFQSLQDEELADSQKELAATGLAAANNLMKIIEGLLSVTKIEEGKFGYNFQEVDLVSFLQSAITQVEPVAREYGVKVFMESPSETSIAAAIDAEKMSLVMANLLENAIQYNVPNGQVVISAERRADSPFIQVNVADTGIGIPQEDVSKLFTKFFRAENARTKITGGSGLGLYIVKNIIRRHGGQVWAESTLGRGSIFHFTLPIDPRLIPSREVGYEE